MKWMMWAALVLLGALAGWALYRYWQRNQELIPSAFREVVTNDSDRPAEDESVARAS
jgi:ABC-type nickel/cobalt efflux system permease component RcnA